jgi:uncharacterized protein (UPF0548 family)
MAVRSLSEERAAALRAADLTYPRDVVVADRPPPGYHALEVSRCLRRRDFDAAVTDLMGWRVHDRAGLRVRASEPFAELESVVELRLGAGWLGIRIPCRVVEVFDEPGKRGFAYGTLPGHPERGEERFVLERHADGSLRFTVSAVSRPGSSAARLGGPVARAGQRWMARRYVAALDRLQSVG